MTRLLIAAAAFSALAGGAVAQPAYDSSQGAPPSDYPTCTHRGQDRCMQRGGGHMHGKHMGGKHMGAKKGTRSSADGERG